MRASSARVAVAVAVVAVVSLVTAACSKDNGGLQPVKSPATTARAATGPAAGKALETVAAGKLTACTHTPHAPFEIQNNGQFDGIDIELVRAVAGRLGLAPEFVDVDAAGLVPALDAGRCDVVASSVTITPELQKTLDFTDGYFQVDQSLLVRKADESRYTDLAQLSGRTIGVQPSTAGADYARANAKGATLKELAGADELFAALKAGQVDAVVQDQPVNAYHSTTAGDSVVTRTFTGAKVQYGLAMRRGRTSLESVVNDALTQVKADDTYPTILRRFLGGTAGRI